MGYGSVIDGECQHGVAKLTARWRQDSEVMLMRFF
jgi:hypothetical protein